MSISETLTKMCTCKLSVWVVVCLFVCCCFFGDLHWWVHFKRNENCLIGLFLLAVGVVVAAYKWILHFGLRLFRFLYHFLHVYEFICWLESLAPPSPNHVIRRMMSMCLCAHARVCVCVHCVPIENMLSSIHHVVKAHLTSSLSLCVYLSPSSPPALSLSWHWYAFQLEHLISFYD